jgi:2-C-methyl-D-erythritol 4-phosphate cytidylyltransferase/2-C-methyl-D-erythritol 2,4-cyclodiphosphate synthase
LRGVKDADGIILGRFAVPTVKRLAKDRTEILETLERRELFEAETPQLIKKSVLLRAYQTLGRRALGATDESSLVERIGGRMAVLAHSGNNVKVTTPEDLDLVNHCLRPKDGVRRFGLGFDSHKLVRGRPFFLGGVRIRSPFGPLGHSDGDPLLHAVIDGVLGALALGDIGDWFPDSSRKNRGISSAVMAEQIRAAARNLGWGVSQIDATVLLDQPKLGGFKEKIKDRLARIFHMVPSSVSVKAKTTDGLGARAGGVSAQVLVVLERFRGSGR